MDFTKLNEVSRMENNLPLKKINELEVRKTYVIKNLRMVQTKYGARVIVDIDDSFAVFLPARICKLLVEDKKLFDEMLNQSHQTPGLSFQYLGGQYHCLDFISKTIFDTVI